MWAYAVVGKARQAQGDKNGAIESYLKAIELAGVLRAQFRSEEFKTGFFSDTQTIFNETIDLLMAANRSDEAFDVSERSRARALLDMIRNRVIASQGIDAFADAQTNTVSTAELRKILPTNSAIVSFHVTEKASTRGWFATMGHLRPTWMLQPTTCHNFHYSFVSQCVCVMPLYKTKPKSFLTSSFVH